MTARPDIAERNRAIVEMAKENEPEIVAEYFGVSRQLVYHVLRQERRAALVAVSMRDNEPTAAGLSALDLRIIALAIVGKPPRVIRQEIPEATQNAISTAIGAARRAGIAIPDFRPPARPEGPTKGALAERERSKKPAPIRRADAPSAPLPVSPNEMTADDDQRLTSYWTRGNCNITHLAALMRKKYAVIHEAVERLNLSRAPGIVVERRVAT